MKRAVCFLGVTALLLGVASHHGTAVATDPVPEGPGGPASWTFTYPNDGEIATQIGPFMGTALLDGMGIFSLYSHTNTNPNNVYPSELDLIYSNNVSAIGHYWTEPPHNQVGDWFATIYPFTQLWGEGVPIDDAFSSTVIVPGFDESPAADIITAMGGDSVHYKIIP